MALTIQVAAENWLFNLETRKRRPAKAATIQVFSSYVRNHISLLGHLPVQTVDNAVLRDFVGQLSKSLAPKTVCEVTNAVKQIVASVVDSSGSQVYPRVWNADFIDAPMVQGQRQPIVSSEEIEQAMRESGECDRILYALASGTGARIGELLALRIGPSDASSHWNPGEACLTIRTSLWRGLEQAPKTINAIRTIEIVEPLNDLLKSFSRTRTGFLFGNGMTAPKESTLRSHLAARLPGKSFHSFRRYRARHLRSAVPQVPEEITRYFLGHSNKSDMTSRYSQLGSDANRRRNEVNRVGLGFDLPQ